ncbi:hypothetical protein [Sphingomonas hengshuiensis]|uniref:Uncharacterized protein n=1 Tax=Sphingomonas hengshuiensis TaxID=1609977 RepID=A0A7U4J8U9_9SPHN|nr:hypothetical protein [Sphingomonas hengshuiensis]AJP72292.1 hypothetical protein TS85_11580 [Sphingomonas hengshuiensis]
MASDDGRKASPTTHQVMLANQARAWSAPTAHDGRRPGADLHSTQGRNLSREVSNWPAPTVMMTGDRTSPDTFAARQRRLKDRHGSATGNGAGVDLAMAARMWPAPMTRDYRSGSSQKSSDELWGKKGRPLERVALEASQSSLQDQRTRPGQQSLTPIPFSPLPSDGSISGQLLAEISVLRRWSMRSGGAAGWRGTWTRQPRRQLNPWFAELLMRWPTGWSAFDCSETGLTQWLHGMRGFISTLDTARRGSGDKQGELF